MSYKGSLINYKIFDEKCREKHIFAKRLITKFMVNHFYFFSDVDIQDGAWGEGCSPMCLHPEGEEF